jgi:hypothetical protein
MFLTREELEQASGRKRAPQQVAWALARGFIADAKMTDADGRPLVLRSIFLGGMPGAELEGEQPDFGALNGS